MNNLVVTIKKEGQSIFLRTLNGKYVYEDGSAGPIKRLKRKFTGKTARKDAVDFALKHGYVVSGA